MPRRRPAASPPITHAAAIQAPVLRPMHVLELAAASRRPSAARSSACPRSCLRSAARNTSRAIARRRPARGRVRPSRHRVRGRRGHHVIASHGGGPDVERAVVVGRTRRKSSLSMQGRSSWTGSRRAHLDGGRELGHSGLPRATGFHRGEHQVGRTACRSRAGCSDRRREGGRHQTSACAPHASRAASTRAGVLEVGLEGAVSRSKSSTLRCGLVREHLLHLRFGKPVTRSRARAAARCPLRTASAPRRGRALRFEPAHDLFERRAVSEGQRSRARAITALRRARRHRRDARRNRVRWKAARRASAPGPVVARQREAALRDLQGDKHRSGPPPESS